MTREKQKTHPVAKVEILILDVAKMTSLISMFTAMEDVMGDKVVINIVTDGEQVCPPEQEYAPDAPAPDAPASVHPDVPVQLRQAELLALLDKLVVAHVLKDGYQLNGQSWTQCSVIVAFVSGMLARKCMWSAFAELWGCDKGALRSAYYKHCDTLVSRKYYELLCKIIG